VSIEAEFPSQPPPSVVQRLTQAFNPEGEYDASNRETFTTSVVPIGKRRRKAGAATGRLTAERQQVEDRRQQLAETETALADTVAEAEFVHAADAYNKFPSLPTWFFLIIVIGFGYFAYLIDKTALLRWRLSGLETSRFAVVFAFAQILGAHLCGIGLKRRTSALTKERVWVERTFCVIGMIAGLSIAAFIAVQRKQEASIQFGMWGFLAVGIAEFASVTFASFLHYHPGKAAITKKKWRRFLHRRLLAGAVRVEGRWTSKWSAAVQRWRDGFREYRVAPHQVSVRQTERDFARLGISRPLPLAPTWVAEAEAIASGSTPLPEDLVPARSSLQTT
jgi:hypothetical protein